MKAVVVLLFVTAIVTTVTAQERPIPQDMMPPLMVAAATGSVNDVRRLLQGGADANEKIEEPGGRKYARKSDGQPCKPWRSERRG